MNIAVLTSSRADYGIYLPLLRKLKYDPFFNLHMIVFGTHLSKKYGQTIGHILSDGFNAEYRLDTVPDGDSPLDIANAMGSTIFKFSSFWSKHKSDFDLVFCLGDRYEMFAAVAASVPFGIKLAHLHGGESTLGAIDNKFRHAITIMSELHFVSTDFYANKVKEIMGEMNNIFTVGALSLDNLKNIRILSLEKFMEKYGVNMKLPTVLVTFHPETISYEKNPEYVDELIWALEELKEQVIITMPNADTMGNLVRKKLQEFADKNKKRVYTFESLGTEGYFSCMNHCRYMLGNSSSGIIEAASFGKYVINIGNRQKGRLSGKNVLHCSPDKTSILKMVDKIAAMPGLDTSNIYGDGTTAEKIIQVIKNS